MRRFGILIVVILMGLAVVPLAQGHDYESTISSAPAASDVSEPGTSQGFTRIGHSALLRRGMNSAPALYRHYVYVGSRTDGSPSHENAGVLVVDDKNPPRTDLVGEIGRHSQSVSSQTSRELRVWPGKKLLMVMNFTCSTFIHACVPGDDAWNIKFYDLSGENAAHPKLISTYKPSLFPHEMFLWVDPERGGRALLYISVPHNSESPNDATPNLLVTDISRARRGIFKEVATFTANPRYTPEDLETRDVALHSMGVSPDGRRTHLAYLGGGFLVLDSSDLAAKRPDPRLRLLTPVANSPRWDNQTVHSAVKVPNRMLVVTTDEIYGDLIDDFAFEDHGCPWGWVHFVDVSDPARPELLGAYKIEENSDAYCASEAGQDPSNTFFTSYAAHNPTVLRDIGFTTWHSGGLQAFNFTDPSAPKQTGFYSPKPLVDVDTEDPALSQGLNKVVMWSYPIIKDGLIYVTDIRNGLYILRYTGRGHAGVDRIGFYEGNSNRGLGLRIAHN
ncbi:MAG: hypothetical protein H0U16_10545 [Actinobacteria bacterium]|nr:hypothetical protein [Actinomycetota bacterium]